MLGTSAEIPSVKSEQRVSRERELGDMDRAGGQGAWWLELHPLQIRLNSEPTRVPRKKEKMDRQYTAIAWARIELL
jgi:hypothetical protein